MLKFIVLLTVFSTVLCAPLILEKELKSYLTAPKKIVAFYNVFADGDRFDSIVKTQVATIKGSGLLDKLDNVYYATMGKKGRDYEIGNSSKYVHIAHYGDSGSELLTLNMLYQFCNANPKSKVMYFHDKGSFHHAEANIKFCSVLNCYVLNTHCIDALDTHDTCGWRISPIPHPHYSGNFWWARCEFINTLIDPMAPIRNTTFIAQAKLLNHCVGVGNRYFGEFWIGTAPTFLPADCMNSTIDTSYVYGYEIPHAALDHCHGPDKPSGLPCQTASTYIHAPQFTTSMTRLTDGLPKKMLRCKDTRSEIVKSTRMIYGQYPHTFMAWMERAYANNTELFSKDQSDSKGVKLM